MHNRAEQRLQRRLNSFIFRHHRSLNDVRLHRTEMERDPSRASKILSKLGILIVEEFYPHDDAVRAGESILQCVRQGISELDASNSIDTDAFYVQSDLKRFKSYAELASANKPVLNLRSRDRDTLDAGFIDFFGIDRLTLADPAFNACKNALRDQRLQQLLHSTSGHEVRQMNLYVNEGITNPRQTHVDSFDANFKCFLYLTDVNDLADGPYSYVPGSHRHAFAKRINQWYNRRFTDGPVTEMPIERKLCLPAIAPAGTLIVSCQAGIHSGHPQEKDRLRTILVDSYY